MPPDIDAVKDVEAAAPVEKRAHLGANVYAEISENKALTLTLQKDAQAINCITISSEQLDNLGKFLSLQDL